jgi:hypothetical protein
MIIEMKSKLEKLFTEIDILERELEEDIISYYKRRRFDYKNIKEASLKHKRINYILFRKDFKRYLIDNKICTLEIPIISMNLNF